jgi:hypothetical protein
MRSFLVKFEAMGDGGGSTRLATPSLVRIQHVGHR